MSVVRPGGRGPAVVVERAGLFTTLQDLGRHGLQHLGIVPCGAMDTTALRIANALVGNLPGDCAIEITLRGPTLRFECDVLVAIAGALFDAQVVIGGTKAPMPLHRPVLLPAGASVKIGHATHGARGYLAVAGGFAIPPVLGSRATYVPAGFGGFGGRALEAADRLPLDPAASELAHRRYATLARRRQRVTAGGAHVAMSTVRWSVPASNVRATDVTTVRCIDGHHRPLFSDAAHATFESATYRIAPESNRMGYRMQGPALARSVDRDVLSEPTCLGSVQVPADGRPIVLMADHQTTGGYAKIAEVASADIALLAQLAPGAHVRFARCTLDEAVEAARTARDIRQRIEQAVALQFGTDAAVSESSPSTIGK